MTPESDLDLDLDAWRARVLARILRVVVAFAGLAALGGIALSIKTGVYFVAVFDACAWLAMLTVWRAEMTYRVRAGSLVGLTFLVGVVILAVLGPAGAGHLWLIGAPISAALLLGRRGFITSLTASGVAILAFAVVARWLNPWPRSPVDLLWWILVACSIASVALLVGLPTLELLDGIERSLAVRARARDDAQRREREQTALRTQFELLFAESPAALMLVDPAGIIVRHNVLAQRLFELEPSTDVSIERLLGPQARAAAARVCESTADVERPSVPAYDETIEGRSASDRPLTVAVRISAIRIEGRTHALVGAVDVGERVAAQHALQRALGEKVTLLQEVHHRVKNNLQIVSSLLGLQADRVPIPQAREALIESTHRVRTMALIHQQLYGGEDFSRVEFGSYARTLVEELRAALAPNARVTFELEPVELVLANALPCGLILNELVTNALKHGRSEDGVCRIAVSVRTDEGRLSLEVRDEGPGLSTPWRELKRRSLGGSIIDALVRQLRATFEAGTRPSGGARFRLRAPTDPDEPSPSVRTPARPAADRASREAIAHGESAPRGEPSHDGSPRTASKDPTVA
jgi:two-component sensor histidine kinase